MIGSVGASFWGSAPAEAMLALCSVPVHIEDVTGFDRPGAARDRLLCVNALGQVPMLLLPDGTVMTESAAIAALPLRRAEAELDKRDPCITVGILSYTARSLTR